MDTTFRLPRPRGLSKTSVEPPLQPDTFSWPKDTQTPDTSYFQNDLTEEVMHGLCDAACAGTGPTIYFPYACTDNILPPRLNRQLTPACAHSRSPGC